MLYLKKIVFWSRVYMELVYTSNTTNRKYPVQKSQSNRNHLVAIKTSDRSVQTDRVVCFYVQFLYAMCA